MHNEKFDEIKELKILKWMFPDTKLLIVQIQI